MLRTISWGSFGMTIGLLLLLYYGIIIAVYYRAEWYQLALRLRSRVRYQPKTASPASPILPGFGADSQPQAAELLSVTQQLADCLRQTIAMAASRQQPPAELLLALQKVMQPCQQLKNTPYQSAITQLIEKECFQHCAIQWDAYDLASLWTLGNKEPDSFKTQ